MERSTEIGLIRQLFGTNFIGVGELRKIAPQLGIRLPEHEPEMPYTIEILKQRSEDSILLLGVDQMDDGSPLSIISLRNRFGIDPGEKEPCFYNQDWYMNEEFIHRSPEPRWYLLRKSVIEESRGVQPSLLETDYKFPSAALCSYAFFAWWFHAGEALWKYDFIWCSDYDHNGDRIYVGKYIDIDGMNKNGYSIHRHLSLRSVYGAISVI